MQNLLKKGVTFQWDEECLTSLEIVKEKMVHAPTLMFPNWNKEFHVHVDVSCIALRVVLSQPSEEEIDHPITFVSRKLSKAEKNYTTIEREGLEMYTPCKNLDIIFWDHISRCLQMILH